MVPARSPKQFRSWVSTSWVVAVTPCFCSRFMSVLMFFSLVATGFNSCSIPWKKKATSLGRPAAVHQQAVADDERGLAGGEPNHGVGDFLRSADSADRVHGRHRRLTFALLPDKTAIHVGLDLRGQHRVDADALLAKFDGSRFRQADDSVLAGDVDLDPPK